MRMILRPTPDFFDLEAWQRELEWLRAQPDDLLGKEFALMEAVEAVAFLESRAQEAAKEAHSGSGDGPHLLEKPSGRF